MTETVIGVINEESEPLDAGPMVSGLPHRGTL